MSSRIPWLSPRYISLTNASTSAGSCQTASFPNRSSGGGLRKSVSHELAQRKSVVAKKYFIIFFILVVRLEGNIYTHIKRLLLRIHSTVLVVSFRIKDFELVNG